jgi:hypothetical protein
MTHLTYDNLVYGYRVASLHGARGALAPLVTVGPTEPRVGIAQSVRESQQLGAQRVAQINALCEQRSAPLREALALQAGDLAADVEALHQARDGVDPRDVAAQDDRFAWSPLRALLATCLVLVGASPLLLLTNREHPATGLALVCSTVFAAMVAQLAGRAFGKAAGHTSHQRVVGLVSLAVLVVVVCALLARHQPLAATIGIAAAGSAFVLGWLAGRHDHVIPRQQRVQRVTALRANVAEHRGAVTSLEARVRDEWREAAAAIEEIKALAISACAIRCSSAPSLAEADELLRRAESTIETWHLNEVM